MSISMDSLPPRYQKQAARKLDPVAYEKALQFFHAEESAKNPARQAQGSISRATGEGFEAQILTACAYYRAHGIAEIDKTPEPIKVISGRHQNPSGCWSFEAVFTKQARALESHANMGALAFVLVCLRGRAVYRVMWEDWQNMKELFGHKYMTAVELEPYRVQLRQGVIRFLGDPE